MNRRIRVRSLVVSCELLKNGNSDPGVMGDLVPDTDALHAGRKLDRVGPTEETGVEVSNALGDVDRVQLDIEHGNAGGALLDWIVDEDHDEVEVGAMSLQHMTEKIGNLLLDSILPITLGQVT